MLGCLYEQEHVEKCGIQNKHSVLLHSKKDVKFNSVYAIISSMSTQITFAAIENYYQTNYASHVP